MVVLLEGTAAAPRITDRRMMTLADPEDPDSAQPYHAALDLGKAEGAKVVARLVQSVHRFTGRSIAELFEEYGRAGHQLAGAGIVVGSEIDPKTIKNDHIRAHAEEGRLFRVAVEEAVRGHRLEPVVTVERELFARASAVLGRPEGRLKETVTALGKGIVQPWRAEEKAAALAAWMALARSSGQSGRQERNR